MTEEKGNKKGAKNFFPSKKTLGILANVVAAVAAVLGLTQASKPTQIYVQGNQNAVVLCEQSCSDNSPHIERNRSVIKSFLR